MDSNKKLLQLLDKAKKELKKSDTIQKLCEEHGVSTDYIDLVPMTFTDLDVSARTDKGIIYFNTQLIDDFIEKHLHYMAHELTHNFQQCFGDGPTTGSQGEDYLDNKYEIEGFQTQTEYITETRDDEAADEYIDQVLDHHDVPKSDRKQRKDELLNIALQSNKLFKDAGLFVPPKKILDELSDFVRGAYSSNVLAKAEKELTKGLENNNIWDALESEDEEGNVSGVFQDIGYLFFDALDDLKPGEDASFNLGFYPENKLKNTKYAIKGYLGRSELGDKYTFYLDGGYDNSGKPIKAVAESNKDNISKYLSKVHQNLDKYIEDLSKYRNTLADHLLESSEEIEYKKLIEKCKEQKGSDKNWSEMWPIPLEDILDGLKGSSYVGKDFNKMEALRQLETMRPSWPPVVTVELFYKNKIDSPKGDAAGQWVYGPMSLELAVGDLKEYNVGIFSSAKIFDIRLFSILTTLNHEIIHMIQFILKDLKGGNVWHGLPSKKMRDSDVAGPMGHLKEETIQKYKNEPEYTGDPKDQFARRRWEYEKETIDKSKGKSGHIPHSLMDVEFYTYLSDTVNYFNEASEGESPELKTEHAKIWVGEPNNFANLAKKEGLEFYVTHVRSDPFFVWLKNQAPKKWEKAVKEFFKATNVIT